MLTLISFMDRYIFLGEYLQTAMNGRVVQNMRNNIVGRTILIMLVLLMMYHHVVVYRVLGKRVVRHLRRFMWIHALLELHRDSKRWSDLAKAIFMLMLVLLMLMLTALLLTA